MDQISIFSMMYETYKIRKPVRLIETFSGYGSQSMALKRLGVDFEYYRSYDISFSRYYNGNTTSWNFAWNKVGGVCYNRKKQREEGI